MKGWMRIMMLLVLAVLLSAACTKVHEFPEPGQEVDPTYIQTKVKVDCKLDLEILTVVESKAAAPLDRSREIASKYDRRFQIEIYHDESYDKSLVETIVLTRPADDENSLQFQTDLHAMKYKLVIWMDYVLKGSTEDQYYITSGSLSGIHLPVSSQYVAGSDFKDAQYTVTNVDLTPYAEQWYAEITIKSQLTRPVARITFLATDMEEFARKTGSSGDYHQIASNLDVEFFYSGYFPTGFNCSTGKLNDSEGGYSFRFIAEYPCVFGEENLTLVGSDFVFVNGEESSVTITAIVRDRTTGEVVNEVGSVVVPIRRGAETVVKYKFLTKEYNSGIGIDPGFSGDINIYV